MSKKSKRRLAKFLHYAGAVMMGIGFFYVLGVAGESDFESEIHQILHPDSWYWVHSLVGIAIMLLGSFLDEHKRECYWIIVNLSRIAKERKMRKEAEVHHG